MASEDFTFLDGLLQGPAGPPGPAGPGMNPPEDPTDNGKFAAAQSGDLVYIDAATATSRLNQFSSTLKGLVPSSGGGTINYLRADGSWAAPVALPVGGGDDYKVAFGLSGNLSFAASVKLGTAGDSLLFGGTATTGAKLNFPSSGTLSRARNNAGTGNVDLLTWGAATDRFWIGDSAALAGLDLLLKTGGDLNIAVNGTPEYGLSATALTMNGNNLLMGGGFAQFSGNTASQGEIRFSASAGTHGIWWRNNANNADISGIFSGTDDVLYLGDSNNSAAMNLRVKASGFINLLVNAVAEYQFDATNLTMNSNNLLMGGGFASFGTNAAGAGAVRLANNLAVTWRNTLNTLNIQGLTVATDNAVYLGDSTNGTSAYIVSAGGVGLRPNGVGSDSYTFTSTQANFRTSVLLFGTNASGTGLIRVPTAVGTVLGSRNFDNSGDLNVIGISGNGTTFSDLLIGDSGAKGNTTLYLQALSQAIIQINAANVFTFDSAKMFVKNTTAAPGDPTGGGFIYADAGAGKWRGSSGTVTTFGPAEPHCPRCDRDFALEWESTKYGKLSVCMSCVVDALIDAGIPANDFVIERRAA